VPLYQFWCDECFKGYDVTLKLAELDAYNSGELEVQCPICKKNMRNLICPPKTIRIN